MFTLLIVLGNLSILEILQEYAFLPYPDSWLLSPPFLSALVSSLECFVGVCKPVTCQSLVFDGVIGVHRGFTTFFTYCPPLLLGLRFLHL